MKDEGNILQSWKLAILMNGAGVNPSTDRYREPGGEKRGTHDACGPKGFLNGRSDQSESLRPAGEFRLNI